MSMTTGFFLDFACPSTNLMNPVEASEISKLFVDHSLVLLDSSCP
jgi:hypothetical protein